MKRRLTILFIHSTKYDYNNLLYRFILSSGNCINHNLILPYTKQYKDKYYQDLINKADIIVAEVSNPSFTEKLELKYLTKIDKPILYFSFDNKINPKVKKYVNKIENITSSTSFMSIIDSFVIKHANISKEELEEPSVILGELE